jgi:hypothetical protein
MKNQDIEMVIGRKPNKSNMAKRKFSKWDSHTRMNPIPRRGMPATYSIGSDRYAGTIVDFTPSYKTVWFEFESANMNSMNVLHTPQANPRGGRKFTLRESGIYREVGSKHSGGLLLGVAENYLDPSF